MDIHIPLVEIGNFLNSNFLIGLFTLATALVAYHLYRRQQSDYKKNAAKQIYYEISDTENTIAKLIQLRDNYKNGVIANLEYMDMSEYLMPASVWTDYRYLFVNNFSREEWDRLESFFSARAKARRGIESITEILPKNIEAKTSSAAQAMADIAKEYAKEMGTAEVEAQPQASKDKIKAKYSNIGNEFVSQYIGTSSNTPYFNYPFYPGEHYKLLQWIDTMDKELSTTAIGEKLKVIASI
jgi:hypothetical protein